MLVSLHPFQPASLHSCFHLILLLHQRSLVPVSHEARIYFKTPEIHAHFIVTLYQMWPYMQSFPEMHYMVTVILSFP